MYSIQLHNLQFTSPVGVYPEEKMIGNLLEPSVDIDYAHPESFQSLSDTLDYEAIYKIIVSQMQKPWDLLESLVHSIISEIKMKFEEVLSVQIKIVKKNPPIAGLKGDVGITLKIDF